MKVILLEDIKGKGKKDQVIEVSDGYAKNYLLKQKLAIEASATALNELAGKEAARQHRYEIEKAAAIETAKKLEAMTLVLHHEVGKDNKLYGAITTKDIAEELKNKFGVDIDKKKLCIEAPIKTLGMYIIKAKLFDNISANITIEVKKGE